MGHRIRTHLQIADMPVADNRARIGLAPFLYHPPLPFLRSITIGPVQGQHNLEAAFQCIRPPLQNLFPVAIRSSVLTRTRPKLVQTTVNPLHLQRATPTLLKNSDVFFERSTADFNSDAVARSTAAKLKLESYYKLAVDSAIERNARCIQVVPFIGNLLIYTLFIWGIQDESRWKPDYHNFIRRMPRNARYENTARPSLSIYVYEGQRLDCRIFVPSRSSEKVLLVKSVVHSRNVGLSPNVSLGAVGSEGGHWKGLCHEEFAESGNVEQRTGPLRTFSARLY